LCKYQSKIVALISLLFKINQKYKYHDEIDLSKYVENGSDTNNIYKLFSVLVHDGRGSSSGHYYAFINSKLEQWYKFNDHVV
jgi:uncharacterized UBP type Zn finger protein